MSFVTKALNNRLSFLFEFKCRLDPISCHSSLYPNFANFLLMAKISVPLNPCDAQSPHLKSFLHVDKKKEVAAHKAHLKDISKNDFVPPLKTGDLPLAEPERASIFESSSATSVRSRGEGLSEREVRDPVTVK